VALFASPLFISLLFVSHSLARASGSSSPATFEETYPKRVRERELTTPPPPTPFDVRFLRSTCHRARMAFSCGDSPISSASLGHACMSLRGNFGLLLGFWGGGPEVMDRFFARCGHLVPVPSLPRSADGFFSSQKSLSSLACEKQRRGSVILLRERLVLFSGTCLLPCPFPFVPLFCLRVVSTHTLRGTGSKKLGQKS